MTDPLTDHLKKYVKFLTCSQSAMEKELHESERETWALKAWLFRSVCLNVVMAGALAFFLAL